jgi:hypothetical protein
MNIASNLSSFIRQSLRLPAILLFCVVRLFAFRVAEYFQCCSASDSGHVQKLAKCLLPQLNFRSFPLCILAQSCFKLYIHIYIFYFYEQCF